MKRDKSKQSLTLEDIIYSWDEVVDRLGEKNSKIAHFLEDAKLHSFDGKQVLIEIKGGSLFHIRTLEKDAGLVESEIYDILDQKIKIKFHAQESKGEGVKKKDNKKLLTRAQSIITELSNELEEKTSEHAEYKKDIAKYKEMAEDKIDFYDAVMGSDDWLSMDEVAKILHFNGWGSKCMFKFLREGGVLKTNIGHNQPYQQYVGRGYFKLIEQPWNDKKGNTYINRKTVVSQRGVEWIRKQLNEYNSNI